ncbi:C45 family peptidase [Sphaerisporangium sp. TRM90804]|uniref:linear amide C-N hydrolase n=1 Tax=Sphaerisporangium sp. TRM90804 TaxID=3031113 RepID=UPI00244B0F7B|nr:C45 family peptidase [Sphaerisporangium sp. TRM90804]MDH2425410.1 linear amide C-N hydrolase [Sphaerisporangium sp. TRM90804]
MPEPSRVAVTVLLVLAALTGCATGAARPPEEDAAKKSAGGSLSADHAASLATLRKVDDHPLWTMRFTGGYDPFTPLDAPLPATGVGCSLFSAHGDPADPVFGRNFDYPRQPALLLFTTPPSGHASVSMVDVSYLGVSSEQDFATDAGRRALLKAPLLPFDGMNAKGLVVGMATVPRWQPVHKPGRRTIGSVRVMRLVLDGAATVDEAVEIFGRHNIDTADTPPLHYMVADAEGRSAIIEFVDGEMVVRHGEGAWQAMVNFIDAGSTEKGRQDDPRYHRADRTLRAAGGRLTPEQAMDLLSGLQQHHTQWSIVYGKKSGEVRLATGQKYHRVHRFHLPMG